MTEAAREELIRAIEDDVDIVYLDEYMITTKLIMLKEYQVKGKNIGVD